MALGGADFGESLMREIRAGRSFGGYPLGLKMQEGKVSRQGPRIFAKQFFLQVDRATPERLP